MKLAFNSVPDFMFVSPGAVLLVEAKVESAEGKKPESGYAQYENLQTVANLLHLLLPGAPEVTTKTLTLAGGGGDLSWSEVIGVAADDVDPFTEKALVKRLNDGYPT